MDRKWGPLHSPALKLSSPLGFRSKGVSRCGLSSSRGMLMQVRVDCRIDWLHVLKCTATNPMIHGPTTPNSTGVTHAVGQAPTCLHAKTRVNDSVALQCCCLGGVGCCGTGVVVVAGGGVIKWTRASPPASARCSVLLSFKESRSIAAHLNNFFFPSVLVPVPTFLQAVRLPQLTRSRIPSCAP